MAKIEEFTSGRVDVVLLSNRRQTRHWLRKVSAAPQLSAPRRRGEGAA
ncbi:hypothetical protein ACF068_12410 [Streptomyces sp. NPDC016309]